MDRCKAGKFPAFTVTTNGESGILQAAQKNRRCRFELHCLNAAQLASFGAARKRNSRTRRAFGSCCAVITPTLAVGKGFGRLALTSTAGGSLPATNEKGLGHTITWNNAIQYHLATTGLGRLVWPEAEFNSSFYKGGANDGHEAVYATPGIIFGRVPLTHNADGRPGRLGLTFGAGEQIALTHFNTFNHATVLTLRLPF